MNSEPSSTEYYVDLASVHSPTDTPQVMIPIVPEAIQAEIDPLDDLDYLDRDDLAFAKDPTLMINQEFKAEDAQPLRSHDTALKFYVQGIVQDQRAYLVTNLLGCGSQTLFQPQMVWTIGRNREAALPLRDRVLSRRHAVILYTQGEGFYLIDLNSMNGSYVNGVRIQQRQLLNDGDRIRIGNVEFSFFATLTSRTIEPIHPEVLARFTSPSPKTENFVVYSALEEPEICFNTLRGEKTSKEPNKRIN
jgi:pSer/pThr/pTyr-binding forkhead associated (FHA) protein